MMSLYMPDKYGEPANVLLGYDNVDGFIYDKLFLGASVGRYANRIANASFVLDGTTYKLARNNGPNHLHGGLEGFNKKSLESRRNKSKPGRRH
ncbi:MAG: hypothetical protein HC896_04605 [Bacteroidales bacterium]|nr:hypothetical protein [Bacteroidales bacterium]